MFNVANKTPLPIGDFYRFAKDAGLKFNDADKPAFINACEAYVSNITDANDQVVMQGLLNSRPGYDEYLFESYLMALSDYHKDNFMWLIDQYDIELGDWPVLFADYFKQWLKVGFVGEWLR